MEITTEIALNPMVEVSKWCKSLHKYPNHMVEMVEDKVKPFRVDPKPMVLMLEIVELVEIILGRPKPIVETV